ncbi:MAG: hypothetical protein ACTSU0_06935 [Alphaproteobacteria bacterium]
MKRLSTLLLAGVFAATLSTSAVSADAPLPAAPGGVILVPIACVFILPLLISISLQRALTGEELTSTTLMCFTGPLGYYIATENGWIGPDFFQGGS